MRTIFARGDFSTLVIACLLMLIPVLALSVSLDFSKELASQRAAWPVSLNQLIPVSLLSVIFGFLLARSHYSELLSLILSGTYSVGAIVLVQILAAPGNVFQRISSVINRFVVSVNGGLDGGTGLDPYLLVLFLSVLIWFLGHNTAWHIFRLDRVWRAILPPGIVLVLNSFYNSQFVNLDGYLILYVFLALLLIIRSHIEAREFDWYMNRITFKGDLRNWFFRAGAIVGMVMLILAWVMPTGSAEENARRFQEFLSGDVMARFMELMTKLFGSVEGQGVATADYYGGDRLTLGGAIQLGDQIVMSVQAPAPAGPRYYWKSRVFDTYSNNDWRSERQSTLEGNSSELVLTYPAFDASTRREVTQRYTMVIGASRLIYGAPQPVIIRVPVTVELDYVERATGAVDPSVIRPQKPLKQGEMYTLISSVSAATASYLRRTPANYPAWVTTRYLQLPPNISARVRNLAQSIVTQANAQTAYDRARTLEQWVRTNIKYNERPASPPAGVEFVDWVLFTSKEGYCTAYASAMIVMLRSLGIPARMAAGFSQGIWEPRAQSYIVRERDAHTWVEVYFPGAGWVEFEPTSAQQLIERPDPEALTPSPTPSPTFTATPTPSPVPTSTQSGASNPPPPTEVPQPQVTMTPTPTPTPLPTPTPAGPPPSPLNFLDLPPPVRNFFSMLLAIAGIVAVISFAAVTLLWWVEYRGLDRLGPIGRAYARLAIYARWLGIALSESNTPLERGRRIAREVPAGTRPVIKITDTYISERYAPPHDASVGEEKQAEDAWRRARRAFIIRKLRKWLRRN